MTRFMLLLMLLLPLAVTGCGDDVQAKLDRCKDDIRAELAALLEKTKHDAAESLKDLDRATPADHPQAPEAIEATAKFSNELIKAIPDMFAAMAAPLMEVQLQALEPTEAGLSKCQEMLAQARRN